jgi:hypothetical protein
LGDLRSKPDRPREPGTRPRGEAGDATRAQRMLPSPAATVAVLLFKGNCEVIGVNTAIISDAATSIGFAVPSDRAVVVIDQLRQFGKTRGGQGVDESTGALVASMPLNRPAAKADVPKGAWTRRASAGRHCARRLAPPRYTRVPHASGHGLGGMMAYSTKTSGWPLA